METNQTINSDSQGIGHPQTVDLREIVNAILYWVDNGIKWRAMPHDS